MILTDSLQLRRTAIAYLFQNVITPERADTLAFYDEVNKEGLEFPEMQHLQRELVMLRRVPPDHVAEVHVGAMEAQAGPGGPTVPAAFRFLFAETGSTKPFKFYRDAADTIYEAFRKAWGARLGRLQLTEVSYIATLGVNATEGAAGFMRDYLMQVDDPMKRHLGRDWGHFTAKLSSGILLAQGAGAEQQALPGAGVDIEVQSHPQDPRLLVLTLLVKWPLVQLRLNDLQIPVEVRAGLGGRDFLEVNVEPNPPHDHLDQVYKYLGENVVPFLSAAAR